MNINEVLMDNRIDQSNRHTRASEFAEVVWKRCGYIDDVQRDDVKNTSRQDATDATARGWPIYTVAKFSKKRNHSKNWSALNRTDSILLKDHGVRMLSKKCFCGVHKVLHKCLKEKLMHRLYSWWENQNGDAEQGRSSDWNLTLHFFSSATTELPWFSVKVWWQTKD